MSPAALTHLRSFEGYRVCLALEDGRRIDDCHLISVCRHDSGTVWLFANGADTFVKLDLILDVWEP